MNLDLGSAAPLHWQAVASLGQVAGQELLWVQPRAGKREHELRAGDEVLATLRFERGSLADAESGSDHWTFKRAGFWHPRVTARTAGSDDDLAIFRPHWTGGGQLDLATGRQLQLRSANFWQSEWVWQEKDQVLIRIKGRRGLIKANGAVEILPSAADDPDLAMLVLLAWYLILLYAEDSSAAASSGAIVAATT